MCDVQASATVHSNAIRPTSAIEGEQLSHLRHAPVCLEWGSPNAIPAGGGHEKYFLIGRQDQTVRTWNISQQQIQLPRLSQTEDSAGWIVQTSLPLIRKVNVSGVT